MRTPEPRILEHVLHPESWVRREAIHYFVDTFSRDIEVTRTVIRAFEQFGNDGEFRLFCASYLDNLAHDDETFSWVVGNYDKLTFEHDFGTVDHGKSILRTASIGLLTKHISRILSARAIPRNEKRSVEHRIELQELGADVCWDRLHHLCEKHAFDETAKESNLPYMRRLVGICARDQQISERLLDFLGKDYGDDAYKANPTLGWLEPMLVEMAGEMRLTAAIRHLVRRLNNEGDYVRDGAITALAKINHESAIPLILEHRELMADDHSFSVGEALGYIRSDKTASLLLDMARDMDLERETLFAHYAITQFDTVAVDRVRDMVRHDAWDEDTDDLKDDLIAAATIMGVTFPEYAEWYAEVAKSDREETLCRRRQEIRSVKYGAPPPPILDSMFRPAPQRTTTATRAGPNEPCPCGSGKKFKKCCMRAAN